GRIGRERDLAAVRHGGHDGHARGADSGAAGPHSERVRDAPPLLHALPGQPEEAPCTYRPCAGRVAAQDLLERDPLGLAVDTLVVIRCVVADGPGLVDGLDPLRASYRAFEQGHETEERVCSRYGTSRHHRGISRIQYPPPARSGQHSASDGRADRVLYPVLPMAYRTWFQCIAPGCGNTHPLGEVVYHCGRCGNLLEVRHDIEALRHRSAVSWMRLFDDRYKTGQWPYGSAIWGKKEWVLPEIDNENIVSMYEGGTNLFWTERLGQVPGHPHPLVQQVGLRPTRPFKEPGLTPLLSPVE